MKTETEDMEITVTQIGIVSTDDSGTDQYVLLKRLDDVLTPEQAIDWLHPQVYRDTNIPGGKYCHTVRAVQAAYSTNVVICTIEHRYDI